MEYNNGMCDIKEENARTLLGIVEQRRQHWSTAISTLNGFAVTVILAIWTFFIKSFVDDSSYLNSSGNTVKGQPFAFSYIVFASGLSCVVFIFWRWYAKYLDINIASLYPEIMSYESILGVKSDTGISGYILNNIFKNKINGNRRSDIEELNDEQRISLANQLVDVKRIGTRGHQKIDNLCLIAIFLFFVIIGIDFLYTWENGLLGKMFEFYNYPLLFLKFMGYLLIIVGLVGEILIIINYQREPGKRLLEKMLNNIAPKIKSEEAPNVEENPLI